MKKQILLVAILTASVAAEARRGGREDGGRPDRPETITCGLEFAGVAGLQAVQSVVVQNAQALLRGEAQGINYVFSVRGKTAVARIVENGQAVTAQGAIEMLRHGGEARGNAQPATNIFRRGEDDANDGSPEREAGFQLALASASAPTSARVALKCESVNQTNP